MILPDAVERAAADDIRKYRASSLEQFRTNEISIRLSKADPGRDNQRFGKYDLYIYGQPLEMVSARLVNSSIELHRPCEQTTFEEILARVERRPNPLEDKSLASDLRQARAWEDLRRWWAVNGKCFNILQLPRELRDIIYGQLMDSSIKPFPRHASRRLAHSAIWPQSMLPRLRLTSHQICNEVSQHVSLYSTFQLCNLAIARSIVGLPWLSSYMRHVKLQMDAGHCLILLKCRMKPGWSGLSELRRLHLDSLTIELDRPPAARQLCIICYHRSLLSMLWPDIRGQPLAVVCTPAVQNDAQLQTAIKQTRLGYSTWKQQAISHSLVDTSLATWDCWKAAFNEDTDGGVALGEDEDHLANKPAEWMELYMSPSEAWPPASCHHSSG